MIRMKHLLHGFHLANSLEEVDMRKNGWVEDVPAPVVDEAVPEPDLTPQESVESVPEPVEDVPAPVESTKQHHGRNKASK
jgi:hypothetical protein